MTNFAVIFLGRFLFLLLVLLAPSTTLAIDDNHPLREYLRSMHKVVAGSNTLRTPQEQARAVKDFRKRFDQHRLNLLEQAQAKQQE